MSGFDTDTEVQRCPGIGEHLTFWAFVVIMAGILGWCISYSLANPVLSLAQVASAAVFMLSILATIGGFSATWHMIANAGTGTTCDKGCQKQPVALDHVWRYGLGMLLLAVSLAVLWSAGWYIVGM